ncbi:MAG: hypothetical protein J07HQX50_01709 [Haloquadratum sp. J07HQX50]|nr:MAG: hypothetical protein J07HQX50_01709 [Haloquadratum sp. J07HQX50]
MSEYIDDPGFDGTIESVREHYQTIDTVIDNMAHLGEKYPTLGFAGKTGWYRTCNAETATATATPTPTPTPTPTQAHNAMPDSANALDAQHLTVISTISSIHRSVLTNVTANCLISVPGKIQMKRTHGNTVLQHRIVNGTMIAMMIVTVLMLVIRMIMLIHQDTRHSVASDSGLILT